MREAINNPPAASVIEARRRCHLVHDERLPGNGPDDERQTLSEGAVEGGAHAGLHGRHPTHRWTALVNGQILQTNTAGRCAVAVEREDDHVADLTLRRLIVDLTGAVELHVILEARMSREPEWAAGQRGDGSSLRGGVA